MKTKICVLIALLICLCSCAVAFASTSENYLLPLYAGEKIYAGPGYEFGVAQTLAEDGTFTIVAQEWDGADNLWGKLKSGAGWVFLRSESAMVYYPIYADFATEELIAKGPYEYVLVDETLNATEIAIYANETLTDVCFFEHIYNDNGCTENPLYNLPVLTIEKPLVAAVPFYGDMTTYGVSFTDENGVYRCFDISISGMDGSLVLTESNESAMIYYPIYTDFATEELIAKGPYEYVLVDETLEATEIAIYANETLTDVCFFEHIHDDNGCTENPLYNLPVLTIEKPIVAAVAFYGDNTVYGIAFTDEAGMERCFDISISGMDGSLVLTECVVVHHIHS